ncbi:MAG: 1-deoxy-D-xylulose-5-phosphate synthase, partial [Actinobacteria bacterium]|nr:1-deoxy-D-xylulose-5-phosphate synthase [Actinomycetota bacterium]NIS36527.1 1-deoxy-D-xylulose-5-phosphate synthase [Actinomycetota bacterium]NIT98758.1 1-deoxy-D-xylulose-5-phosphate synthase [Actinomycetota bacterium]NIU22384.1 1-deoxy-D-xylulose-5-phosphate synthase [Actinomycetota bacterium]NIU71031.1 1-deoxy-D-xylulose-5-phosphate synthase [Actinomycetota bacterium]
AGLAMAGKRPVVAIYSSFLQRAFDQLVTDVALHDLPVVFLLDRAGVTGPDGPSHHGVFDLTYLRMIPNMVIGVPSDADELCGMLETALDHPGPIAIRYPKASAASIPALPVDPIPIGRWQERSSGDDVLFLAAGRMVERAEKASAS